LDSIDPSGHPRSGSLFDNDHLLLCTMTNDVPKRGLQALNPTPSTNHPLHHRQTIPTCDMYFDSSESTVIPIRMSLRQMTLHKTEFQPKIYNRFTMTTTTYHCTVTAGTICYATSPIWKPSATLERSTNPSMTVVYNVLRRCARY
jgi:hypothetical protein